MSRRAPRPRRSRAPSPPAPRDLPEVFAALGDRVRFRLVRRLVEDGPVSITSLTRRSGVTRQAVTKHLSVLSRAGLVAGFRRGRERIFRLETAPLADARAFLGRVAREWDDSLARLRHLVEGSD
jgi:DNA-binding transcriptional ArsR family regulator